jgi:uncharacterized protein (TIGR02996 family)
VADGATYAALLAGVLADPDDDAARRVYGDALLEAGDPRGELIQLELALEGALGIRPRAQLAQRHTELVAQQWRRWFPYKVAALRTRGGFACAVTATLGQLRAAGELFAREPVTRLDVLGVTADGVGELLALPWLPRVRYLTVRGLPGAAVAELWRAPALQQLHALNLTAVQLTPASFAALDDDALPALRNLVLSGNHRLGRAATSKLRAWRPLAQLESLYLASCGLDAQAVHDLVGAPLPRLTKLVLSRNPLTGLGGAPLDGWARRLPALRTLELQASRIDVAGATALVAAQLPGLATLDLRETFGVSRAQQVAALAAYVVV